jgi:hypothetical protein
MYKIVRRYASPAVPPLDTGARQQRKLSKIFGILEGVFMDYIQTLKDIVAIDTTVPPGRNYEKIMDYLTPLFKNAGCEVQKVAIRRSPPAEKRDALTWWHTDAIPVSPVSSTTPTPTSCR